MYSLVIKSSAHAQVTRKCPKEQLNTGFDQERITIFQLHQDTGLAKNVPKFYDQLKQCIPIFLLTSLLYLASSFGPLLALDIKKLILTEWRM